jgi:hypothetical protein
VSRRRARRAPPPSARRALGLALLLAAAGCAPAVERTRIPPPPRPTSGPQTLVVGVDRDRANRQPASALARELAFALSQRGRASSDLAAFAGAAAGLGRPVPDAYHDRLLTGVVDPELAAYLQGEGVQSLIVVEVPIVEQVWTEGGKRTRVAMSARGHDLAGREPSWQASTAPEVGGDPGRGFQIALEAGLGALVRAINREPEPLVPPRLLGPLAPVIDTLKWW